MSSPFERQLREQLMAAARRGPRRRKWPTATAVGGLAAAIAAFSVFNSNPAVADVEIRFEHGRLEVTLTDLENSASDVAEALEDAGVEAKVGTLPAGPSNVGRFVQVHIEGEDVPNVEPIDRNGDAFTGFSVPQDWDGTLRISLGRPAREGEPYAVASDAFAAGEPLDCRHVLGQALTTAADELRGLRVRIQIRLPEGLSIPEELSSQTTATYSSWVVVGGRALAPDDVLLELAETVPEPIRESGC